jgi:hypothetical protein
MKKSNRKMPRVLEFRNHEAFVRDLVKKIPAEANRLGREAKKLRPDSERTRWTKAVKNIFHVEALKLGKETIDFYDTRSEQEKKYHEWLLHAVLYVESRGILVAVESEFGRNVQGVVYDFWKLLSVKAALKILILDSGKPRTRYAKNYLRRSPNMPKDLNNIFPGKFTTSLISTITSKTYIAM